MSDKIDWKKLRSPYGPAGMIPELMHCLPGYGDETPEDAYKELIEALVADGQWGTVSAPVVHRALSEDYYGDSLQYHLALSANVTAGNVCHYFAHRGGKLPPNPDQVDCWEAVEANLDDVLEATEADSPVRRGAAALLLCVTPPLSDLALPVLEERWNVEDDGVARATVLQALVELDDTGRWMVVAERIATNGDESAAMWGMAASIWLRNQPGQIHPRVIEGIGRWQSQAPTWFNRLLPAETPEEVLSALLGAQSTNNRNGALNVAVAMAKAAGDRNASDITGNIIRKLLGIPRMQGVIPASRLTVEQRSVAERIADTRLYPNVDWMPRWQSSRKRWLGLSDPGLLEKPIQLDPDSNEPPRPLWETWLELNSSPKSVGIPSALARVLSPYQRWHIAVRGLAYGCHLMRSDYDKAELLDGLSIDDDMEREILALAREILDRDGTSLHATILLLLPLVRANREIPADLCELAWLDGRDPLAREVMSHLPPGCLQRAVRRRLSAKTTATSRVNEAERLLSILDMVPEPGLCDEFVHARDGAPPDEQAAFDVKLAEAAEHIPELRESLTRCRDARRP